MNFAADVINSVLDLPSLPAVVMELLATMHHEDIDTHALAARIALDAALAAKTLRLANSSFYGLPNKVTTIQQAIAVLGFHSIRTLVTACSVTENFSRRDGIDFDFEAFWRHAIASAVCARVLAPHLHLNPDNAFTAGLLHDLGTLVMATKFPEQYRRAARYQREQDCLAVVAELAVFGTDHTMVGSALTAHWKFPRLIQEAVAEHHQAPAADAPVGLTALVYLANVLAHALDLAGQDHEQAPPLSLSLWQSVALSDAAWCQVFADTERMFNEMCQMLTP